MERFGFSGWYGMDVPAAKKRRVGGESAPTTIDETPTVASSDHAGKKDQPLEKKQLVGDEMASKVDKMAEDIGTLNKKLDNLQNQVGILTSAIEEHAKQRNLEWALKECADCCGTFQYFEQETKDGRRRETEHAYGGSLVKDILYCFRRGSSHPLPDATVVSLVVYNDFTVDCEEQATELQKKAFRDTLLEYIHTATGQKPRLEKQDDGQYIIHYK